MRNRTLQLCPPHTGVVSGRRPALFAAALVLTVMLAGCGAQAEPAPPTRTPAPTFTPTTEAAQAAVQAPPVAQEQPVQAPAEAAPAEGQPAAPAEGQPAPAPVEAPTETPAPPTPVPAAELVINSEVNVRGGPGTGYNVVGLATTGQRFPVIGKSPDGQWWQVNYNGQSGWVFGELVTAQNTQAVAIANDIPAPPPPTATPIPAPTEIPAPPPPAEPAPTAAPAPQPGMEFSRAIVQRCDPNAGVTYIYGTVYKGGQPANGYRVAFSYAPDAEVVAWITSGPHQGYEGWNAGYYSHIIQHNGPREGSWYLWIIDASGKRISAIAGPVVTHGTAGEGHCQQAVVDFDS